MISQQLFDRYYADNRCDGTRSFYTWVRQYTGAETILLNLGAGPPTRQPVRILKGEVGRVVAADVDPIVLKNDELDEAHVIEGDALPFSAESFDVVLSDYVLEHVERPEPFISEVYRVLKPGASFFFRTPNKYHYVALISRATPHRFHRWIANRVRGLHSDAHEPWRTFHRLNSTRILIRLAQAGGFHNVELRLFEGGAFLLDVSHDSLPHGRGLRADSQ